MSNVFIHQHEIALSQTTKNLTSNDDLNSCQSENTKYLIGSIKPKNCPSSWSELRVVKFNDAMYWQILFTATDVKIRMFNNNKFYSWLQLIELDK